MRAITLHQPWAALLVDGRKPFETRSWAPPETLIGQRVAIHAGKVLDAAAARSLWGGPEGLERGAVIATATLMGAYRSGPCFPDDVWKRYLDRDYEHWFIDQDLPGSYAIARVQPRDPFGDYSPGRWAWLFRNMRVEHPPVPARGYQRLWTWEPTDLLADLA